jgi:hypothetical protein
MTAVAELVTGLERRGAILTVDGPHLVIRPPSVVTPQVLETLKARKPEVVTFLRERQARDLLANVAKVKLRDLTRILEVAVDWCDVPLLIAPGCRIAKDLRSADPKPGRVWCVCEVLDLLLTSVPPEDAQRIGEAKVMFAGSVTGARREVRS